MTAENLLQSFERAFRGQDVRILCATKVKEKSHA